MANLKVYGHIISANTQRVLMILKEKNVPYELITVDFMHGEHKTPSYLEKHPFGQMPYIDDDGFILFESVAISKYIAAKYRSNGTQLLPDSSDLEAFALFEQACCIESNDFYPLAGGIVMENVVKPLHGTSPNEVVVAELTAKLAGKLEGYEAILRKHEYLAGDKVTIADLAHLAVGSTMTHSGVKLLLDTEKWPNVARWWKDITSRPTWREIWEERVVAAKLLAGS
ncbi:glutathione S-transferase [Irpex rosettiformis]|uniref:Glutathione S-transferase n=1 Tax=Irpex rosettiformis TaxID=378272 RepID=A0ACB8UDE1_9APHY|nr:glutathione S-transferase [Irpex rosettiformis]